MGDGNNQSGPNKESVEVSGCETLQAKKEEEEFWEQVETSGPEQ